MSDTCLCCDLPVTSGLPVTGGWICSDCNYEIQIDRLTPTAEEILAQRERPTKRAEEEAICDHRRA